MGSPHDVHGHADRFSGSVADRAGRSRGAGWRTVERHNRDRPHHFRQRPARDQGREDHDRTGAERSRRSRHGRGPENRHGLHGQRRLPRRPARFHGKAQTAVYGTLAQSRIPAYSAASTAAAPSVRSTPRPAPPYTLGLPPAKHPSPPPLLSLPPPSPPLPNLVSPPTKQSTLPTNRLLRGGLPFPNRDAPPPSPAR